MCSIKISKKLLNLILEGMKFIYSDFFPSLKSRKMRLWHTSQLAGELWNCKVNPPRPQDLWGSLLTPCGYGLQAEVSLKRGQLAEDGTGSSQRVASATDNRHRGTGVHKSVQPTSLNLFQGGRAVADH